MTDEDDDSIEILDSSNEKTPAKKSAKTRTPAKSRTPSTKTKTRTPAKSRTPAKTAKPLRNFNDVLGKKVVAKELNVKKTSTDKQNKETKTATKKETKTATKKESQKGAKETKKSQDNNRVQGEKPKTVEKKTKLMTDIKHVEPVSEDKGNFSPITLESIQYVSNIF